jgi:GrpB-like predicted nucleotidyltransferase (UPF0157 family)
VTGTSAIVRAVADPIVIVDYHPRWPEEFARLRDRARSAMGELVVSIEHATAVPGLSGEADGKTDFIVAALAFSIAERANADG